MPSAVREDEELRGVLLALSADLSRVVDAPSHSVDAFIKHAARLRYLERGPTAIVAFIRTNPLGLVLDARMRLERHVPRLKRALWLLAVSDETDPFFYESASKLGSLDDSIRSVPIWTSGDGRRFVVVPRNPDADRVKERSDELEQLMENERLVSR